jgi:hypothetical protein
MRSCPDLPADVPDELGGDPPQNPAIWRRASASKPGGDHAGNLGGRSDRQYGGVIGIGYAADVAAGQLTTFALASDLNPTVGTGPGGDDGH